MAKIKVENAEITVVSVQNEDYISLTDMAHSQMQEHIVFRWMSLKSTIEYLGEWEMLYNPNFNCTEFDTIRNSAGSNNFVLSVKAWIERTGAIGIMAKTGRYGGTYAHRDIAYHFGMWISPRFQLLLVKEYQRRLSCVHGGTGYLLLLFDSPSELLIDERLMRTAANSAILYTPGSRIYYRAAGEEYRNDWIRFRSDHSFVKLFPLTNTPFPVTDPEYCHQLFKLLTWESAFFSSESEANITHLLRVLFSKLREGIQNESPGIHDHELIALHKMIYNNPQLPWNINMMAAKLHLSPSHLQALYHRQFGSSCMDNVIEGRLRRAQDLLEYSEYSIRDISEQCGYNNVEHFCRQFRQHNGCTPGQYRKNASAGSNKRLLTHNTLGGREFDKVR